jgi:hypothetical protein
MNCGMMFCHVVAVVLFTWGPVVSKLSLTFSVMEPMVFHVHCFQFLDNIVVDNAECSGVVCLHWGWKLGMAHEFEGMAGGNGFSAVDVESPHLSLYCRGHDCLDNLCDCDDGAMFGGLAVLLDMKKCPPARLRAFDSERYDALLCPARTMSLAWYVTIASG